MASPLDLPLGKLSARIPATILMAGDSTTQGFYGIINAGTGYPGFLGAMLGERFDVTVHYQQYNYATGLYDLNIQNLWTSTTDDTVLEIYNGGVDGAALQNGPYPAQSYYDNGTLVPPGVTPDAFFFGYGFNEYAYVNAATFAEHAQYFIGKLLSDYPSASVIVTSQNVCYGHQGFEVPVIGGSDAAIRNPYWNALFQLFIDHGVYLDPVLQQSASEPRVWCLDTLAAQNWTWDAALRSWGVHPNGFGYKLIAQLMFDQLVTDEVVTGDPPVQAATLLDAMFAGRAFSQTLGVESGTEPFTWSVSSGALPSGLSITASTGEISGTPTTVGQDYDFTVSVTNAWGYDTQRFVGTVSPSFHATGTATTRYKLSGQYYPIPQRARLGGQFVHLTPRD